MNEAEIIEYITATFEDVQTATADGNMFFFYGTERNFPFATLVTNDAYDQASNLSRPGVFCLNIGVGKQTYRGLFGEYAPPADASSGAAGDYDFSSLDQVLPHPVYGRMYWVCVLSPSDTTFKTVVQPLLAEAYERDVAKHTKRVERGGDAA